MKTYYMTQGSQAKQTGFTLIELLVVVAIIAILAAVGIPAYNGYQTNSRAQAAEDQFAAVSSFLSAEAKRCSTSKSMHLLDGNGTGAAVAGMTGLTGTGATADYNCRVTLTDAMIATHYDDESIDMQNIYASGPAVIASGTAVAVPPTTLGTINVTVVPTPTLAQNGVSITLAACLDAQGAAANPSTLDGTCATDGSENVTASFLIE